MAETKKGAVAATADRDIVISRILNAPRERVWQAWVEPEHIEKWWGPKGFTTTVTDLDLRVGGKWRFVMRGPDGTDYPSKGTFKEIVPLERIVTADEFDGISEKMNAADLPSGMVAAVLFEEMGPKTKLIIRITHPTAQDRKKHEQMGVIAGWNSSLDCLEEHLASIR